MMTKTAVVTSDTPSVVSGARGTEMRQGESVRADEKLPDVLTEPLHKSAAFRQAQGSNPKPDAAE